jgi:hypothetical protein
MNIPIIKDFLIFFNSCISWPLDAFKHYEKLFQDNLCNLQEQKKNLIIQKIKFYYPVQSRDFFGDIIINWQLREKPLSQEQLEDFKDFDWLFYFKYL